MKATAWDTDPSTSKGERRVRVRIHILSGARAGTLLELEGVELAAGRDPGSPVSFDPVLDQEVSVHHAVFSWTGGEWVVRDRGSRNGTFVNGQRVEGERVVTAGDRVAFGDGGPEVAFYPESAATGRGSRAILVSAVAVLLVLSVLFFLRGGAGDPGTPFRARPLDPSPPAAAVPEDSVAPSVPAPLRQSDEAPPAPSAPPSGGGGGAGGTGPGEPPAAPSPRAGAPTPERLRVAEALNRRAVVRIHVEGGDGAVVTGTAFAVRRNGTLVTNRHVVLGVGGELPRRIAAQFSGSDQVWPARLLLTSPGSDLALIKVDQIVGDVPTVRPLNLRPDTLEIGAPLAILGFPLGGESGSGAGTTMSVPRSTFTAGAFEEVRVDTLVVRGDGADGASGSPVLDERGEVVGVVFGGWEEDGEHRLVAVPSPLLDRFLRALPDPLGP